jgi:hypothetical protein
MSLSPAPIPVVFAPDSADTPHQLDPSRQSQAHDPSMPATTTFQADLTTEGQRRINLIWEYTQAVIAVVVVLANMAVGVYQGLVPYTGLGARMEFPVILSSSLFLIVGFYFSRTNHSAIGGVGPKAVSNYVGR